MFVGSSHFPGMIHIADETHPFSLFIMYDLMEEEVYEFSASELPDEPCFCPQTEFNGKADSLFFTDGVRKIDFILVYEDEDKKDFEKRHTFQRHKVSLSILKSL